MFASRILFLFKITHNITISNLRCMTRFTVEYIFYTIETNIIYFPNFIMAAKKKAAKKTTKKVVKKKVAKKSATKKKKKK